eukprot:m.145079 g.145079  ORF g.145079 m.145079 type:complete len:557 (-) comp23055_c0_seq6:54-1724(-)
MATTQPLLSAADPALQVDTQIRDIHRDGEHSESPPKRKQRLVSLDAIRGLTVCVMIFVDNLGSWFPRINHSPWNYVTLADFVMPFFLFMVGCSMSLTFKKYKAGVLPKVMKRTAKLFVIGLVTQGSSFPALGNTGIDLKRVRIPGILQRIAWAYLVTALIALYVPQRQLPPKSKGYFRAFRVHAWQWAVAVSFLVGYLLVMLAVPIPSWSYTYNNVTMDVKCDMSGDLTPACSPARWVDVKLIGLDHMFHNGCFDRTSSCSSCPPAFCPKPFRCPIGVSCPNGTASSAKFRFVSCPNGTCPNGMVGEDFAADWCGARLDPEGTLASMPTIVTTFIGYHFGMVLQHFPDPADRLRQWVPQATGLLVAGVTVQAVWWPASKQLWSPAYMLIMAGANGIILSLFYALLDFTAWQPAWMRRKWKPSDRSALAVGPTDMLRPFVWVGMNTIFIYLFSPSGDLWERLQGNIYWDTPDNNLVTATYRNVFCHAPYVIIQGTTINQGHCHIGNGCRWNEDSICHGGLFARQQQRWAQLVWILLRIGFWVVVAGVLHYRGWYWAL